MATYDGDITLSVDVTPGDVKKTATNIRQEIEEIFASSVGQDLSKQFRSAQVSAAKLYDSMGGILERMRTLENTTFETDEFAKSGEKLTNLVAQLNDVRAQIKDKMSTPGISPNDPELTALVNQLKTIRDEIKTVEAERDKMRKSGTAFYSGAETVEYDNLKQKLNEVTNRATIAKNTLSTLAKVEIAPVTGKFGALISTLKTVASFAGKAVSSIRDIGGRGIKIASSAISGLGKAIKTLTSHTNKNNNALQLGFKNFIRYGLGVRSVFALINKLRRALMEGLGNLAQYSSPFNAIMSQFVSSLATLQNAFATAFAPILTVVLPILSALMDALVRVISLIGQFFAALTGKGTFVQAKRVNKDYAGSLGGVGKSAGGASKGMDKANKSAKELERTISGFDDVEILHENKPTSSGSGGGSGGGGGGGVGGLNPNDMFETVEVESPIADMANRIRELIANQDWKGLGVFLGLKINSVFKKAKELISWDNLGERITFVINAITTTFNSLIETIDWDLIGSTFAEGINTILKSLNLLITGINWGLLGTQLMTGLNALIRDINWEDLGLLLANGVNALFDFLYGALSTFDWKTAATKLTSALNTFIQKTDWKKIGKTLSDFFKTALRFLFQALGTFDWSGLGQAFLGFLSGIDWAGLIGTAMSGISGLFGMALRGLVNTLSGLGSSLGKALGSLLTGIMSGEGGNIIAGFFNGILAGISGVWDWIKTNIVDPFIKAFEGNFEIGSPSKLMQQEGTYVIQGLYNGITNKWKSIKAFFSNGVKGVVSTFKNTDWKSSGSNIVKKIKGGASGAWSTVSSFFSKKTTDTKEQFTRYNWKPAGTTIVSGIRSGSQSVWADKISSYFKSAIQGIKNKFLNSNWAPSGQKIITGIKGGITSKYSQITTKMSDLVTSIKNKFNNTNWKSIGENICSGIKSGISRGWSWVTDKARELAEAAYDAAKKKLDINSPSKLFRDKIGRCIPEGMAAGIEAEGDTVITAVKNLSGSLAKTDIPQLEIPAVALGEVIPYETSKNIDTLNETMKTLMDVLKYTQTATITRDDLTAVLNTILPTMLQRYVSFYIGDEQIARHANAGNSKLDYRFNPVRS